MTFIQNKKLGNLCLRWVVLVHVTQSNNSRSSDARFMMHKLRKHA